MNASVRALCCLNPLLLHRSCIDPLRWLHSHSPLVLMLPGVLTSASTSLSGQSFVRARTFRNEAKHSEPSSTMRSRSVSWTSCLFEALIQAWHLWQASSISSSPHAPHCSSPSSRLKHSRAGPSSSTSVRCSSPRVAWNGAALNMGRPRLVVEAGF